MDLEIKCNNGLTCLHSAIFKGNIDIIIYLLDKGANINAVDNDYTNTFITSYQNLYQFDIIKILFDRGFDIEMVGQNGLTTFLFCCKFGNIDLIKLLLNKGVNVNTARRILYRISFSMW